MSYTSTTSAKTLNVTDLDFDQIKSNLKAYFTRADSPYKDWNFEGSGLNLLLDVLAYNTHYNAILAHMTFNESFIDSAQLRANVVSRAKLLGYVPRSRRAARSVLTLSLSSGTSVTPFVTRFSAKLNGTEYTFLALDDGKTIDSNGNYQVTVAEGTHKTARYSADESLMDQAFVIEDSKGDMSTLFVKVYSNASKVGTGEYDVFFPFVSIADADENSPVYFISENTLGKYEISFGDGVIGRKLTSLNVVEVGFISSSGSEANGAGAAGGFTPPNNISIMDYTVAAGGGESESIESIRFNAPNSLITQNRAVTANDYRAIITSVYPGITSLNIWGGDEEAISREIEGIPEIYEFAGKVYVCPNGVTDLTAFQTAINSALSQRRVFTIKTVVVPPDKTYLYFDAYLKYATNRTVKNASEVSEAVRSGIAQFAQNTLQNFGGVFRYSTLLRTIDSAEDSVINSLARVYFYKNYDLPTTLSGTQTVLFPSGISCTDLDLPALLSTKWQVGGVSHYFKDSGSTPSSRNLHIVKEANPEETLLVGTVNLIKGLVTINLDTSGLQAMLAPNTVVKLYAQPVSDDIAAIRDQILEIDLISTTIESSPDELSQMGSTVGGTSYETFTRAVSAPRVP